MYWIEDGNGRRQPRANAPQVRITNLQEVFGMLDAGTDPCVAHAEYANGDTMDVEIPSNYARNSIGRKTRIRGNELFIKRLNVDLSYLARYGPNPPMGRERTGILDRRDRRALRRNAGRPRHRD